MSDLTAFVRPAYENLLCSFAMVTLSEFAIYLDDIDATLALMERTSQHVSAWWKSRAGLQVGAQCYEKICF